MKTTHMSVNKQKDKHTMLYPSNGILLSNKNNELQIHTIMTLKIIMLSEKSHTKIEYILYDCIYLKF